MVAPDAEERTTVLHESDRMVFFCDAVVAIAITLLALDLPVPHGSTVWQVLDQFRDHGSEYGAFFLSFFVVGGAWQAHHQLFSYVERIDPTTIGRNIQWLLLIVVTPFVSKLITGGGEEHDDQSWPVRLAIYGLVQGLMWITLLRIERNLRERDLLTEDAPRRLHGWVERRIILSVMFLGSAPLAFVNPWIAAGCWWCSPLVLRGVTVVNQIRARRSGLSAPQGAEDDEHHQQREQQR